MKEKINLYSYYHNGDIFYSRLLVNVLMKKYDITYYHNLKSPLFEDMEVEEIVGIPQEFSKEGCDKMSDKIINTWIGKDNFRCCDDSKNGPGCSLGNYMGVVYEAAKLYDIEVGEIDDILPSIEYTKLKNYDLVKNKMDEFKSKYRKIVLVSNGPVYSNQSYNFLFDSIVDYLAEVNKDTLFIVTDKINIDRENIISSNTITEKLPDLLLIGYISTYCDIIVGRASGPYCFAQNKENFSNINKTFISFTRLESEGVYYKGSKSKNIWSDDYSPMNIFNVIQNEIIK